MQCILQIQTGRDEIKEIGSMLNILTSKLPEVQMWISKYHITD